MSDERKTLNISTETYEYLASVGERRDTESADTFLFRIAETLADSDEHTDVIKYEPPENALTAEHIDDIAERTARKTADEVEHRLR